MSSYSEYLGRMKQRMPQIIDTRPQKRSASHQTEIVRRVAAAGNLETVRPSTVCAPSRMRTFDGNLFSTNGGHRVRDAQHITEFVAGNAVAQSRKPGVSNQSLGPQMTGRACMTTANLPEINDKLAADANLSAIKAQKNAFERGYTTANCCNMCKKVLFASTCPCGGLNPANFKNTYVAPRVVE